jgi:hypothetical protein
MWHHQPEAQKKEVRTVTISLWVVKYFLGEKWINRNLAPDTGRGYMKLMMDGSKQAEMQAALLWDLAELFLNLQDTDGFDQLVRRMRTGEPEAAIAELRVGRILYINEVQFRFVVPRGAPKNDYDLEIVHPNGAHCCGETKCKVESTTLTASTIEGALEKARSQMPPDRPGIIFLKIPKIWVEDAHNQQFIIKTAIHFLGLGINVQANSEIVSVVLYGEPMEWVNGILAQGHRFKEILNPHNKFDRTLDWSMLHYMPLANRGWDALPENWIRLVNFPDELRKHGRR